MCGIVGFTGKNEAAPILLDGLSKLDTEVMILLEYLLEMETQKQKLLRQKEN